MRVNNCVAWVRVSPCLRPYPFHQCRTDPLPKSASNCGVIKIGPCCVWWKIVGQISPFAAVIRKAERGIHQFRFSNLLRFPARGNNGSMIAHWLSLKSLAYLRRSFLCIMHSLYYLSPIGTASDFRPQQPGGSALWSTHLKSIK